MARAKKSNNSSMKVRVPGAKNSVENMKYEIANEFGVNLGPDATSRANGKVGGEMTKRLVENGMNKTSSKSSTSTSNSKKRKSNTNSKSKKTSK